MSSPPTSRSTPSSLPASAQRVLITGINGFVAPHIASIFLSHGWIVRGTVRSASKKDRVLSLPVFKPFLAGAGDGEGKVEIVIVEDFGGSDWSEALDGVDAVVHAASPFDMNLNVDGFIKSAVEGTTKLVEAASTVETIRAFAYVSSIVAVLNLLIPATEHGGKTYTEDDWLALTEEDARKEGAIAPHWYCVSKKLAELAAREVYKSSNAKFALSTYCPPGIYGPPEHLLSAAELAAVPGTDLSMSQLAGLLKGGENGTLLPEYNVVYVDVRDLAQAIFKGITLKTNGRYLTANETVTSQKIVNIARRVRPDLAKYIVKGETDVGAEVPEGAYKVDVSKSENELGVKYRTLQDTVRDTLAKFEELGAYKE
ncbi:hypothetical protein IAU59_005821 [Kwoniella sp. CBS 9459]